MDAETAGPLIARVESVELQVTGLRQAVDAQPLAVSDRQYLARCFDLLDMELEALRQYLSALR